MKYLLFLVRLIHLSMPITVTLSIELRVEVPTVGGTYPAGHQDQSIHPEEYIHCDGTQLRLTDSNLGQEQYQAAAYYYWWSTGSDAQLLFIFPTRVSLTTITLHYYSDSIRQGLPRLRFYAVPDDFDIWDAPRTSYPRVVVAAVPPGGGPAGRRNISISVNFNNTKRVLVYKYVSGYQFAVSVVVFYICSEPLITTEVITTTSQPTIGPTNAFTKSVNDFKHLTVPPVVTTTNTESTEDESYRTQSSNNNQIRSNSAWTRELVAWILVVILVILLILSLAINVIQAIWTRRIWRNNKNDISPECALAMDSNPCYDASNVKPTEAQEAVHVYETVIKQYNV